MNLVLELFIPANCSHLRSFVHHVVRDIKVDDQKLFMLTRFSKFIGLCRVNVM